MTEEPIIIFSISEYYLYFDNNYMRHIDMLSVITWLLPRLKHAFSYFK